MDLQLVGHTTESAIEFDEKSKNWKLPFAGSNVSGLSYAAHNTYLLGKQNWSIKGDLSCQTNGEQHTG